jgi:hypothetical protein
VLELLGSWYLDEVTILSLCISRINRTIISHLKKVFNPTPRCRRYKRRYSSLSLNPKKSIFTMNEGKLLGFIVSKHGMWIEPKRTKAITKIPPPHNKNLCSHSSRRINFVRRFIPSFSETVKPLQDMIKKNVEFRWGSKEKEAFDKIKKILFKN